MVKTITLSKDSVQEKGLNLQWVVSQDVQLPLKDISLEYRKTASQSQIKSMLLDTDLSKVQLTELDSGASYYLKLQVTDRVGSVFYSNNLQCTTPFAIQNVSITDVVPLDSALRVTVVHPTTGLSELDSVEFVCVRSGDPDSIYIVKPFDPAGIYLLQDDVIQNGESYSIACKVQPHAENTRYAYESEISNTIYASPSNFPNVVTDVVMTATEENLHTTKYDSKLTALNMEVPSTRVVVGVLP
jgi:hypothetical protein